jgi:subtilase family serine protease
MLSDGYYAIGKAKGKFVIAMDKLVLDVGEHDALAEVVLDGETLTATTEFVLKPSIPPLPDLVAKYFFAPSTIMKNRNYITLTIETNEGTAKAKEHKVKVYLSEDDELGEGDEALGQGNVEKLKAGWFKLVPVKIKAPRNAEEGESHLIVKVDATDKIQELSEENNTLSKTTNITPASPFPWHVGDDE